MAQQRQAELQALKEQVAKLQEKLSNEASACSAVVGQQSQGEAQRGGNFYTYLFIEYGT